MSSADAPSEVREYVRENPDILADVLKHSEDPYARACALVLLAYGGTERDADVVKQEIDKWS